MGAEISGAFQKNIPNIMLICYQAAEGELCRKQDWLNKTIKEMSKQRMDTMRKAKDHLLNKDLALAFASAKAALVEDQKIGALTPIKEKLAKNIESLIAERKKEESQPMSVERLKQQLSMSQLDKLKELIAKWVSNIEDIIPSTSINFIDEIAKGLKGNPVDLFKKLKEITELGDFDEKIIDTMSNPLVKALNVARELLAKKDNEIDTKIEEYQTHKKKCIDQAKENITSKNYINALMMLKTLPIFEGKIQCGSTIKKALSNELKEIDTELKETEKLDINKLKDIYSKDHVKVITDVVSKWLSKQKDIISDLITSPGEMLTNLTKPISMNPMEVIKEINSSGILPKLDITSFMKNETMETVAGVAGLFFGS